MKRIDFIVELIKGYDTVADIGSDHGLVLKKALDLGYIKKGIASDIKQGPLDEAKHNLKGYPVAFYLKDGFKDFKASFDIAVITGMGGYLICEILKTVKRDATYLIGPHDNLDVVRKFLVENNFEIIDEYLIFDKFYYVFLKVKKG